VEICSCFLKKLRVDGSKEYTCDGFEYTLFSINKILEDIQMNVFDLDIPEGVYYIMSKLKENGHKAYIVGGCVRDSLMRMTPKDWDITTSATPQEVKKIFTDTYDTGIKHGTVTVSVGRETFEVTTFRIEGVYDDHRKPSKVFFTKSILEDLKRRDFTMNAIAFHPEEGLIDPFNGASDIANKIIRCVGIADERFKEDALRMLRAFRFSCQLNFDIEKHTFEAIHKNRKLIKEVSNERVREELNKLLLSDHPMKLLLMQKAKILAYILPELECCLFTKQNHPYHVYDVGLHTLKAVQSIEKDIALKWTMLLHDVGKPLSKTVDSEGIDHFYGHGEKSMELADRILKRLRFDNKTINRITRLVKWHDRPIEATPKAVRRAVRIIGEDIFLDLLKVKEADVKAQNPEYLKERQIKLHNIKRIYEEIKQSGQCLSIKDLAVSGEDLLSIGIPEGKNIGSILKKLLDIVIEAPEMNTREKLLSYIKDSE
jgi:tRNA nucleotidyltransferase (CCA-adding enzyme)